MASVLFTEYAAVPKSLSKLLEIAFKNMEHLVLMKLVNILSLLLNDPYAQSHIICSYSTLLLFEEDQYGTLQCIEVLLERYIACFKIAPSSL